MCVREVVVGGGASDPIPILAHRPQDIRGPKACIMSSCKTCWSPEMKMSRLAFPVIDEEPFSIIVQVALAVCIRIDFRSKSKLLYGGLISTANVESRHS